MVHLTFEAPLEWPKDIRPTPRASQRNDHGFAPHILLAQSINYLEQELEALKANGKLLLDIEQPLIDRLRKTIGNRTGACLQFRYRSKGYVLACDRWDTVEHNVYALHLALRHWRNLERWGIGELPRLMYGFEDSVMGIGAIQDSYDTKLLSWMEVLGLGPTCTLDDAIAVYHRRAKQVADDTQALTRLNMLMDEVRVYFNGRK